MSEEIIQAYARRVGYRDHQSKQFAEEGFRVRQVSQLAKAARLYSIEIEVIFSRNCNSGHVVGQKFILDVDGNFITKLCPKKMCIYLISQFSIPVALINERLSEELEPNAFHFMHQVRCPDVGLECAGYGEVRTRVTVIPRG